jgi:hypothetical protein
MSSSLDVPPPEARTVLPRGAGILPVDEEGWWIPRDLPDNSLAEAARLFDQIGGTTIVEIGSGLHGEFSGNSIVAWTTRTNARRIVAVDLDESRIAEVRNALGSHPALECVVMDGVEYLHGFVGTIDLLYLDFWAPDKDGAFPGTGRAEGYRDAYHAAREKMGPRAMILLDDTDHIHPWKHTFIVPAAREDGFRVVYEGRQTLLRR